MIEITILDYLTEKLEYPVYMEIPASPPEQFVLIEKTGGGSTNRIFTATIAVQSYAAHMYEAAALNEQVKQYMDEAAALPELCAVRLNSDYNYTDTASKHYRYQAVFDITHY